MPFDRSVCTWEGKKALILKEDSLKNLGTMKMHHQGGVQENAKAKKKAS